MRHPHARVFIWNVEVPPLARLRTGSLDSLKARIEAVLKLVMPDTQADPGVILYATWISVWGRWFVVLTGVFLLVYRPGLWFPQYTEHLAVAPALALGNGIVHYRLLTKRSVTWRWMLFLSAMDVVLITGTIATGKGFGSYVFVAYYPALAVCAVILSSLWLNFAWTTISAVAYTVVCLTAGSGLDLDAGDERVLLARIAVLYILVLGIGFITRFERLRWQTAVSRERQLLRERIELSQRIHDTTAQTAYMIGLGIHRARELAGESNEELLAALDATSVLSRSAMWEMRGPIEAGHLLEGMGLGRLLWSHCATFERITAVPTEMSQSGPELPLPTEIRTGLFSIAHNALTNAFLHAQPGGVAVNLSFEPERIVLSISDDGVGLPDDYAERGRGFGGMRTEAERMGGRLIVESGGTEGGTTIACAVPHGWDEGGA